jgi:predicted nucleotidyltransferase
MASERSSRRDPQPVIDRFTTLCSRDERIVAGFLGGSHARGEADEHSDLDLCVIAEDEAYEDVVASRAELVRRLGEPLFLEDFGLTGIVFFVLADGTEGEIFFARASRLDDIDAGPHRTLFDPRRILDGVTFPGESVDPVDQEAAARRVLLWFWHELSHFTAAIGRGQLWWAAGQLEALRGHCVNLVRIDQGVEAGEEPFEKLDLAIDPGRLEPIRSTFVPLEREALLRAARDLVRFFTEAAPAVAEAQGTTYPAELARLMVKRLDDLNATD